MQSQPTLDVSVVVPLLDEEESLRELKAEPRLADMRLVQRGNRLSVMPVEPAHWQTILSLV